MYILSYKRALSSGAGLEVRQNLRGGIPPQRLEMYILSNKLALFSGPGVEVRACLHGGGGPQVGEVTRQAVVEK